MMDYRRAITGGGNSYRSKYTVARNVASIKSDSYTKDYDFTFSLGRPTTSREVANLLCKTGLCETHDDIRTKMPYMRINNFATENGQVTIHCKTKELAEEMVDALNDMGDARIRSCGALKI